MSAAAPPAVGARGEVLAPVVRRLGLVPLEPTWRRMQAFTSARDSETPDEFWLLEHPPVYTAGVAARRRHFPPESATIPLVHVDRGGQITYHGPGQVIAYILFDLRRSGIGVRELVRRIEAGVLESLASFGIEGERRAGAPGVYVGGAKIAALGLKIRNGCSYHGVALNVDMDLSPFSAIDPCGYPGLAVTQLADLGVRASPAPAGDRLAEALLRNLGGLAG